jgi:N-acyl-D-aspartate/D-glutamate deacylase
VRERGFSSLEDAHWRLSALPASCAGFSNRGILREGAAADIIVYDYENLGYTFPEFCRDLPGGEYRGSLCKQRCRAAESRTGFPPTGQACPGFCRRLH